MCAAFLVEIGQQDDLNLGGFKDGVDLVEGGAGTAVPVLADKENLPGVPQIHPGGGYLAENRGIFHIDLAAH